MKALWQLGVSIVGALMLACPAAAADLTVADTDGRKIEIKLLAVVDDLVTFTVRGKAGEFELPITRFDQASRKQIEDASKTLKPRYPELEIDVVIGKRRKKANSWYMVRQEVTSKVVIENTSLHVPLPKTKATMIFIGRGRLTGDSYKVLASETFELFLEPGKSFAHQGKKFSTTYDSDNRGQGNVGGYQYDSYVLALLDDEDSLVAFKTSDPQIRSIIEKREEMAAKIVGHAVNANITKAIQPE